VLWRTMQTDYSGPADSSVLAELFAVLSPHRDRARSPRQAATSGSGWQCWNWPWERALFEPDRALRWYGVVERENS
jgi:hypothetical protein